MSDTYEVTKRSNGRVEVRMKKRISQHALLNEMQGNGELSAEMVKYLIYNNPNAQLSVGDSFTVTSAPSVPASVSMEIDERSSKAMAKRLMDTLVKQYAPDADTAWAWMRQAHEIGWEWGNHSIGGPSASDPLGQRVSKSIATAFSNDAGVYVGICLVGGAIRWGWFRAAEWGPRGRDLVLSGDRNHHETPIAAIAEYTLIGEKTPMKAPPLDDVFGGTWDD